MRGAVLQIDVADRDVSVLGNEQRAAKPCAAATAAAAPAGPTGAALRHGVGDGEIIHRDRAGLHEQAAILAGAREGVVAANERNVRGNIRQVAAQSDVGRERDGVAVAGAADRVPKLGIVRHVEVRGIGRAGCEREPYGQEDGWHPTGEKR